MWLPPLDVPDTLDALMPDLVEDPELGLVSPSWRARGGLDVPLGIVDRPREQRRDVMRVNLAGAGGHVAVVGGPRSGKSTLLRTIVSSLALTTTPNESQFYVLDFGGGTFAPMTDLPHVSGVATRSEPDVVRRVVAEVQGIVDRREAYFRQQGIDSIETYRARRRQGTADDGYGDVFLVVDGWSTLRADFDEIEMELQALAQRGLTFGLHLVAGAARWADFRAAVRDVFGTRLELRLGDPNDSEVDRKLAQLVPDRAPGSRSGHREAALPRRAAPGRRTVRPARRRRRASRTSSSGCRKAWGGSQGPKLRLLPERIDLARLHAAGRSRPGRSRTRRSTSPSTSATSRRSASTSTGSRTCWRSATAAPARARCCAPTRSEVMRTRTAQEAQVVVVDYRRSLLGEVPDDYQLHYLTSATQAEPAIAELAAYLQQRLPGPDVTPDQLRNRSWWTGAEVYVVIDDYDLVATQSGSPIAPLVPLLAQARDVGLHLALARRSGGAARALYEPVIQSLRDLAMPGLLLSGSPDEGPLIGTAKPRKSVPGRAQLVTRDRGVEVVQTAWTDPAL